MDCIPAPARYPHDSSGVDIPRIPELFGKEWEEFVELRAKVCFSGMRVVRVEQK